MRVSTGHTTASNWCKLIVGKGSGKNSTLETHTLAPQRRTLCNTRPFPSATIVTSSRKEGKKEGERQLASERHRALQPIMGREDAAAAATASLVAPLVNRTTLAAAVGAAATFALIRLPPYVHTLSVPTLSTTYILPLLLLILAACFYVYYTNWLAVPPTVHHRAWPASHLTPPKLPRSSPPPDHPAVRLTRAVLSQPSFASLLCRPYCPTPWLFSGHLQTLFTAMAPPSALRTPTVLYKRELLLVKALRKDLYDGQIALDWALSCSPYVPLSNAAAEQAEPAIETARFRATDPTVVIVHGLAGGSGEHYIRGLIHHLSTSTARRFRCVVFNQRGCGGQQLISPQAYSGAYTGDLHQALLHIHARLPSSPLLLVGYSLGANVVTRYIGEHPSTASYITACIAISNPWDCVHSCRELERVWWKRLIYSQQLAKNLCTVFSRHSAAFASSPTIDLSAALRSRTLREFDTLCTSAAFGYATVEDYYRSASSSAFVSGIRTACLFVSCLDDAICHSGGIPVDECVGNECCLLLTVPGGGHSMCLYEGWRADSYCVRVIRQYAEAVMDVLDRGAGGRQMDGGEQDGGWIPQPPLMAAAEKKEVVSDGLVAPKGLDNDELRDNEMRSPPQSQPPPAAAAAVLRPNAPRQTDVSSLAAPPPHRQRNAGATTDSAPRALTAAPHTGADTHNASLASFSSPSHPSHKEAAVAGTQRHDEEEEAAAEADGRPGRKAKGGMKKAAVVLGKAMATRAKLEQSIATTAAVAVAVDDVLDSLISFTRRTRLLVQSSPLSAAL